MVFPFLYIFTASLVTLILWGGRHRVEKKAILKCSHRMPQHSEKLDIGLFQRRWSGRLALSTVCCEVFPSFYSNEAEFALWCATLILETKEGCVCGGRREMRFSDQIDLGNGALRSWQAESERLLFDHSGRNHWGRGEHGEIDCHSAVNSPAFPPFPRVCWSAL